jgi:hypothetical protein
MTSMIMDVGLAEKAKLLNGISTTPFMWMALGTSGTAPVATQTALGAEITTNGGARKAATCGYETGYITVWSAVFSFTGSLAIHELAILNALTGGVMYLRHVWPAVKNVENGENILFTVRSTETRVT